MKLFITALFCLVISSVINAQWQTTNGPEGGTINGFVEKGNFIFATEGDYHSGAVYRSSDDGNSWEFVSEGLPIESVVTSPCINQNYIFVGTKSMGVFRSSDLGLNWEEVSNGIPVSYATISTLNSVNDTVFAGTNFYGMYKSVNNGENWIEIDSGLINESKYIRSTYIFNSIIYIGTHGGLYRSFDFGNTWALSSNGIPSNKFPVMDIYSQDNFLFAVALNTFYRSSDNGDSWQQISGVPNPNSVYSFGSSLYAGTYQGIYESTDYGDTWTLHNNGFPQFSNVTEIFRNANTFLVSNNIFGIYKSSDNGNLWGSSSVGIQNTSPQSMTIKDGNLYSGTLDSDFGLVWKYDSNNNNWVQKANGLSPIGCNTLYSDNQFIFAGTDGNGVYRSSDNGNNWEEAGPQFSFPYVSSITGNNNYLFAGLFAFAIDVYRSGDSGDNWEATSVPGSGDIEFVYNYDNFIFTGRASGVYRTSDDGSSWTEINNGLQPSPFASLFTIAGNYIFLNCNDGVYKSSDDGDNWIKLDNFPNYQVYSLAHDGNDIFAGTRYNGIIYSTDLGDTWSDFSDGLPLYSTSNFPSVQSLMVYNNKLYAGLEGLGVWVSSLPSIVSVELNQITGNTEFSLEQNYPNPFNPTTKIRFTIRNTANPQPGGARDGFVTLRIYDVLGREVATLVNEEKPAGSYEENFNAAELPSGIYFYQLKSGNYVETKKMILIK